MLKVETFTEDKNLQADVELMRSPFFIAKALDRLDLTVSYFNRGQILTEEYYTRSFFKIKELSVTNERVRDIPIALDLSDPKRVSISYSVGGKVQDFSFAAMEIIRTPDLSCITKVSRTM
ncbi:MAG: hypothetical protein IPN62_16890 [Flavobacteriales bacterium]|nr:hypothetical protein [Flavobacteriales bacterium]